MTTNTQQQQNQQQQQNIQSEWRYYFEVAQELLNDKLAPSVDQLCRHSKETEALEEFSTRCQHLMGRVGRAISKVEEELLNEWHFIQLKASQVNIANNNTNAGDSSNVEKKKENNNSSDNNDNNNNSDDVDDMIKNSSYSKFLAPFAPKLIDVAELKFKLLQCTTACSHYRRIPIFGSEALLEDTDHQFLPRCEAALNAALSELLSTSSSSSNSAAAGNHHAAAVDIFNKIIGNSADGDINLMSFKSLVYETYQIVAGHVDERRARAGSNHSRQGSTSSQPQQQSPLSDLHNAAASASTSSMSSSIGIIGGSSSTPSHHVASSSSSNPATLSFSPKTPQLQQPSAVNENVTTSTSASQEKNSNNTNTSNNSNNSSMMLKVPQYHQGMSESEVRISLEQFYSTHSPEYIDSIPFLLEQYRNRNDGWKELFALIASKYGVSAVTATTSSGDDNNGTIVTNSDADSLAASARAVPSTSKLSFEEKVKRIYTQACPLKLNQIPEILSKYQGQEQKLLEQLSAKYSLTKAECERYEINYENPYSQQMRKDEEQQLENVSQNSGVIVQQKQDNSNSNNSGNDVKNQDQGSPTFQALASGAGAESNCSIQ